MKLHLGCGDKHIPGWVHIDVVPGPHIQICHPIDRLPMLPDRCAEVIYACHVLEHFPRNEVHGVLVEWRRLLRPGGLLRVAVPDFEAAAARYMEHRDLNEVIGLLIGRQDYLYNFHYNIFDFETLRRTLEKAGFQSVARYDWRQTEHAWLDDYSQAYLPHMDKEGGRLMSLNVEATRT